MPVDTDTVLGESGVVNTYDPSSNKKFFGIEQAGRLYIYPNSSNLFDTGVKNLFDGFDSETGYSRVIQPAAAEKNAEGQWEISQKGELAGEVESDNIRYFINPVSKSEIDTEQNIVNVAKMKPVVALHGNEFEKGTTDLVSQAAAYFESIGGTVNNDVLGDVTIDKRSAKDSIAHGIGRLKSMAFAAVPAVIRNGYVISYEQNWKSRGYDTFVIAAPMKVDAGNYSGEYYVGAIVQRDTESQQFYLHEVIAQQKSDRTIKTPTGASANTDVRGDGHPSLIMLLQKVREVNESSVNKTSPTPVTNAKALVRDTQSGRETAGTNIIPDVSENVNDVKYSLSDIEESSYAEIAAENRSLRVAVKALQEQMTLSRGNRYSDTEIRSIARRFLKDFDSRYNLDTLSKNLRTLFYFIETAPDLNWNQMMEATTDLVKAVLMESRKEQLKRQRN